MLLLKLIEHACDCQYFQITPQFFSAFYCQSLFFSLFVDVVRSGASSMLLSGHLSIVLRFTQIVSMDKFWIHMKNNWKAANMYVHA
jgi:hypothetical protein